MNFKTTGTLLVLVGIVLGVWLLLPRAEQIEPPPQIPPTTFEETTAIFDTQPRSGDIVRVVVERPDRPQMVFSRAPKADEPEQLDQWEAVEPVAVPVLGYLVDGLVSTFIALRSRAHFEPGTAGAPSDAEAGLVPPVATVTLVDKNQREYRIEVGQRAPVSSDTYVRATGTLHIASRDLHAQVRKEFNEYRDKRLGSLNPADAVRVALSKDGQRYQFSRGDDGSWLIEEPIRAYADADQVLALVRKISGLRAQDFVDDMFAAPASYGLDQPYLTATVTTETRRKLPAPVDVAETLPDVPQYETVATTHGLIVGDFADMKQEHRYARLADQEWFVTVSHKDVQDLVPDLLRLRDPHITRIRAADAVALELTADGQTVRLEKIEGQWQGSGDLAKLELPAITDLLQAMEDLSALEYIVDPGDLGAYGLTEPRAVVSVTVAGAVEPVSVRVGDLTRSARNAYVLREGQPTVFVVSAAQANRLAISPLSLRSRQIFSTDPDRIVRLDVRRMVAADLPAAAHAAQAGVPSAEPAERRYTLQRQAAADVPSVERVDRQWQFVHPPDLPVEPAAVRTLVNDLARLRARRAVAKSDDARFGLDQPLVVVEFDVVGPAATPATAEDDETESATEPEAPADIPSADNAAADIPSAERDETIVTHTLRVSRQKTVAYARLDDDPFVYELDETIYEVLTGELINRRLFDFDAAEIIGLTIVAPGGTLEFVKEQDQWTYPPDPYAPVAQSKLKAFTEDLARMRVESYLAYQDGDFTETGLFTAPVTVSIRLTGGRMANLKIAQEVPGRLPRLAGWVEEKRIFRLRQADCERLLRGLDYYLRPETGVPVDLED